MNVYFVKFYVVATHTLWIYCHYSLFCTRLGLFILIGRALTKFQLNI